MYQASFGWGLENWRNIKLICSIGKKNESQDRKCKLYKFVQFNCVWMDTSLKYTYKHTHNNAKQMRKANGCKK